MRVVTVSSRDPNGGYARQSAAAVRASLPPRAEFVVVRSSGAPQDWITDLWGACGGADAVALVDDDDLVVPGALQQCADAIECSGAGLAFTDEDEIDEDGARLGPGQSGPRRLMDLAMHPRCAHHLAVFRPALVPREALQVAQQCGIGLDWLMRAAAGLRGGAVHVPVVGYQWRRHRGQNSSTAAAQYRNAMPALRAATRSWLKYDEGIPHAPSH